MRVKKYFSNTPSLVTIYLCVYLFLYENNLFKKLYLSNIYLGKLIKKVFIVFLKIKSFSLTTYLFMPTYLLEKMTVSVAQVNPGIFLQDVEKLKLNLISFLIMMLESTFPVKFSVYYLDD